MGGLRNGDTLRACFLIPKGTGDIFLEQLRKLNIWVKEEWVGKGNRAGDLISQGSTILLILDNASFHKKAEISAIIEHPVR